MNQTVLIIVGAISVLIIILLVIRNQKDKKQVIDQMKNDYPHKKAGDEDIDVEDKQ